MECQPPQNIETEIRDEDKDDQEERFLSCEDLEECKKIQAILIKFSRAKPKNKSDLRKFLINIAASSTRLLVLLEDESIPKNQNRHFGQKNDKKNEQIPRVTIQRISAGSLCIEPRDMLLQENNDRSMNDKTSGSTSSQCIGFLQENTTQTLLQKDEICNTQLNNETEIVFECKNVEPTITSFARPILDYLSKNQLQDSEISEPTCATIKDERLNMVKKENLDDNVEKLNSNDDCETNAQHEIIPHLNSIHDSGESKKLETCSKILEKTSNLTVHKDMVHDHITHSCEICGKKFVQKQKLEIHNNIVHNGRKLYQCDTRGKTFALKNKLDRHINSIHVDLADVSRKTQRDYLINCIGSVRNDKKSHDHGTRGKAFRKKVGLKKHIESPRRSITHTCDSCGKTFTRKSYLKNHIDFVHKNLKHHQCDRCPKAFSSKRGLDLHMSTVHNGITYRCDLCDKIFTRKGTLRVHIDIVHMNNRKLFKCEQCEKSFDYKCLLTSHIEYAHKGVTHPCNLCEKVFTQKGTLKVHIDIVHMNNKKLFKCEQCEKSFNYKSHLTSHIEYAHKGVTHPCDYCRKVFSHKSNLKVHKDSVHKGIAYPCDQCEKSYSSKTYLKLHIDRIHNGKKPNT